MYSILLQACGIVTKTSREGIAVAFNTEEARRAWDAGAEAWDTFVESGADYYRTEVHGPALLDACGDVSDLRVLDLGCGQGWFSRQLARRGAQVTGVDLSPQMLSLARRHETDEPLDIEYVEDDAADIHRRWAPSSFELVTACMSLHDMPDPHTAIRSAAAVLTSEGRLVFSVPHPASETPYREWERDAEGNKIALKVDRYFESGAGSLRWEMPRVNSTWETPRWHFTLAEWAVAIKEAELVIAGIYEPRPSTSQVQRRPELDDSHRLPYFLILECQKMSTN